MIAVLIDTPIWVDYFKDGNNSADLEILIDKNIIVTNDIILAELIPFLKIKEQTKVINLLYEINQKPLNIDWIEIVHFQESCLKKGINKVGIPDLITAQNAIQNNCKIYSLDEHFFIAESNKCYALLIKSANRHKL